MRQGLEINTIGKTRFIRFALDWQRPENFNMSTTKSNNLFQSADFRICRHSHSGVKEKRIDKFFATHGSPEKRLKQVIALGVAHSR